MAEFIHTNFREHPMFHPKDIMFLFETSVPKSIIDCVPALCNNVRTLPMMVDNIICGLNSVKSRMDTLEDRISAHEQAGSFSGGGGQSTAAKKKAGKRKQETAALRAREIPTLQRSLEGVWAQLEGK